MRIQQAAFGKGKTFLKGALHCHTTRSDGTGTPEEVIKLHYENGYQFMALTDHNVLNHINHADVPMTILAGVERDFSLPGRKFDKPHCVHIVGLGVPGDPAIPAQDVRPEHAGRGECGADAQPISKVASGGELARVMLALKSAINDKDGISTVIFDEIDAGVSGKTARKIGIKMLSLSKKTQLFSVTHSAQIASLADAHYLISKSDINGATETSVNLLSRDGRISELSRILGGIDVTDSQRRAAVDMLDEKNSYL